MGVLRAALLSCLVGGLIACNTGGTSPSPSPSGSAVEDPTLTVGLGYIPSVQFAQFYRAQQQGYYRDAGLEVTFQNQIDPHLITLLGQGQVDIGNADGTSIIPAAGQGVPVRYAATVYARFPNVVVAGDGDIEAAADLAGKTIGIPGRFGSSWIMLQAMLASAGLGVDDVTIREFPDFGQSVALRTGQVDAVTGFANNEPVQLAREGFAVRVLTIDDITPLPGPGLAVGESTLAAKPNSLRAFVAATLRSMGEIITTPSLGVDAAVQAVPELASDRDLALQVLEATIATWQSPYTAEHGLGAIDPAAWRTSLEFMRGLPESNIPSSLSADELVTEELLP